MTCHTLYRSPALEITSCVGDASQRQAKPMHFSSFEVHFQDDGAYTLHEPGRAVLIDVHHVEVRHAGTTRTYSRPVVSADRGTSIRFSSAVAEALRPRDRDTAVEFPSGVVRLGPRGFAALRALRRAIEECSASGAMEVERRAVALLGDVVRAAPRRPTVPDDPRRPTTSIRHRDAVEQAKAFLAERFHERPTLRAAARVVDYAPHHFERIFRAHTGLSVHRYLTELRLRQAAVRLDEGAENLSSLALDLGFSSHSHFTTAFLARFGCPPGVYRSRRSFSRDHADHWPSRISHRAPPP